MKPIIHTIICYVLYPLFFLIIILLLTTFLGYSLANNQFRLDLLFGDKNNWQNIFTPIAILFSSLTAFGALLAVYLQGRQFKKQQFENNFFNLLQVHLQNRKNLNNSIDFMDKNNDIFFKYYRILEDIYKTALHPDYTQSIPYDDETEELIEMEISLYRKDNGIINIPEDEIFYICYEIFKKSIKYSLNQYFRNFYHLIKYTDEHAPSHTKNKYMAIIRAQLSNHEFVVLYYSVLAYTKQDISDANHFKNYIEKYGMCHNMDKTLLFDSKSAGSYKNSAFSSSNQNITFKSLTKSINRLHITDFM